MKSVFGCMRTRNGYVLEESARLQLRLEIFELEERKKNYQMTSQHIACNQLLSIFLHVINWKKNVNRTSSSLDNKSIYLHAILSPCLLLPLTLEQKIISKSTWSKPFITNHSTESCLRTISEK